MNFKERNKLVEEVKEIYFSSVEGKPEKPSIEMIKELLHEAVDNLKPNDTYLINKTHSGSSLGGFMYTKFEAVAYTKTGDKITMESSEIPYM